jgi:hypothetical protein
MHFNRQLPHFCYQREDKAANSLKSLNQKGHEQNPDTGIGVIQKQIIEAIYDVENDNNQIFFDIWCEARLANGQYIQCLSQYRQSKGSRYDWVMMKFESEENNGKEAIVYSRKVLALYEDSEGTLKVLVHSVEYKTATNVEGLFGDSCLVIHYQLEFNQSNRKPRMYSVKVDSILHVIWVYETIQYPQPLVPQVRCIHSGQEHTVMTFLPRKEWVKLFLAWTRELAKRETQNYDRDEQKLVRVEDQ